MPNETKTFDEFRPKNPLNTTYVRVSLFCPWKFRYLYIFKKTIASWAPPLGRYDLHPITESTCGTGKKYGMHTSSSGPLSWSAIRWLLSVSIAGTYVCQCEHLPALPQVAKFYVALQYGCMTVSARNAGSYIDGGWLINISCESWGASAP